MYKVSDVASVAVAGQLGPAFGFNILTSQGQPVVNLSFRTEVEAREALQRVAWAAGKAIRILAYP
jgi:hypothetical protein